MNGRNDMTRGDATPRPGPLCDHFAALLPLLTAQTPAADRPDGRQMGALNGASAGAPDLVATQAHLATCAYCRAQLAAYEATEAALRRHYAIPSGNAPFLTFDAIARRVAATQESADDFAQLGTLASNELRESDDTDVWPNGDAESSREKVMTMTSYGISHLTSRLPAHRRRFTQGLVAIAAAILIVGLLSAVFYTFGYNRRPNSTGHNQIHYLGAQAKWQVVGRFSTNATIYVAQNDPQIIYKVIGGSQLQRSGDGGSTWRTLALPTQDLESASPMYLSLAISPLNAQVIILQAGTNQTHQTNSNCPAVASAGSAGGAQARINQQSGGYSCSFQYVSRDGGATWNKLALPDNLHLTAYATEEDITAQYAPGAAPYQVAGSHLYALANPDATVSGPPIAAGARLMVSVDGGLSWRFADTTLAAAGQVTDTYAATPTGATLFALTIPANSYGSAQEFPHELWRSDDAGAHWTNLGPFTAKVNPTNLLAEVIVLAAATNSAGQTRLYYELRSSHVSGNSTEPAFYGVAPDEVFLSVDNGQTWRLAPSAGVPSGYLGNVDQYPPTVGQLSDGAIVTLFLKNKFIPTAPGNPPFEVTTGAAYYAWDPTSTSWLQLTPDLGAITYVAPQWFAPAHDGQPETIWAIVVRGNTQYLEKCALS